MTAVAELQEVRRKADAQDRSFKALLAITEKSHGPGYMHMRRQARRMKGRFWREIEAWWLP